MTTKSHKVNPADKVEQWPIEKLVPYAKNSRTHSEEQVAQIAASIREWGFTTAVLVDESGSIIAGHGRVMAARKLGMASLPVMVAAGWTDAQKRAYVIADNKLAMNAGWDNELLALELGELGDLGFDLDLVGFTDEEIAALMPEQIEPGLTDDDAVPEVPEQPVTVLGDVWVLGKHRLMCGDSTSVDAVDKLMDGGRASFCFTSPPYNLGKSVALRNGARKGSDSAYNDFQDDGQWPELMRGFLNISLMKSDVSCVNVQMLSGNKFDLLKLFGEYSQRTIDIGVWAKTNPPPAMADGVMTSAFEFMWFLSSDDEPNRRIKTSSFARGTFSNVFSHATASGHDASVHGAVFPLAIAEHYIQNCSQNNDVILEFFGGTGTTLIACEKTGRQARLMELDSKYCDVIIKRWQDFTGKIAVHAETGQPFAEVKDGSTKTHN
jgi:DNA modification methylase